MFNGFLFHHLSWYTILMWCLVTLGLILVNELTRRKKWIAVLFFIILPIVLPFVLWLPYTATPGTGASTGTWFHWVKVYSALAGCIGFMLIRYNERLAKNKWALMFPPLILSLNILEACIRDFQVYGLHATGQVIDGVVMISGPWNIMNGIAGLLNIVAISGWMGIRISKGRSRDMLWPDMMWFWIIAYDLWNFAYVYNCVSDHSFYAGAALLVACTIPAFFIRRGAWLQHRAHTLALWMMFTMSVPMFVDSPTFGVPASHNPKALFVVSFIALLANILVVCYHFYRIARNKKNPLTEEVYVK
ncbi:MAG: DUF5692 family protein [Bacteroidales bacterium]|nr:DUF5692 family protein [Bacteroidales bacterium]